VLVAGIVGVSTAQADGDPASDALYTDRVFVPYSTTISKPAQDALTTTIKRAEKAGYPIRVALIAGPADLGAVTSLWRKPREYARFLDLELSFVYKGPLLIVMPGGIGFAHYKRPATAEYGALSTVKSSGGGDGLALTAITAVSALAAHAGHRITPAAVQQTKSSSGRDRLLVGGVALAVAVAVAIALGVLRRRRVQS
jgi:hypothetical protein